MQVDPDPRKRLSDADALVLSSDRFRSARDSRKGTEQQYQRWYELYRGHVDRTDWPFDTNLFVPITWSTIESFLPRLVSERPRIKIEARNDEDLETARVHRELLDYQWDQLSMGIKLIEFVKSALIYGTAILKVGWETVERERTIIQTETDEFGVTRRFEGTQMMTVYDDPVIDVLPIEDFYYDNTGTDMDTCKYVCHRMKMQLHEIEEAVENKGWKQKSASKLKKITSGKIDTELDNLKKERRTTFGATESPYKEAEIAHLKEFDVIEYWEEDRLVIFVHEPELLLYNGPNPFTHGKKPFIRLVDNLLPWEFEGVGEPEVLESIQIEMNDMHNLRGEMAKRLTMNQFIVRRGSSINPGQTKFKPNGVIMATDIDRDIKLLYQADIKPSGYREEEALRFLAQEATGATDPFKGMGDDSDTATGASIMAQASASRVGLKFQILVEMALRPLAQMLIALNEQYIKDERIITIVGPEGALRQKIRPEDLARAGSDLDVRIDVGQTDPVNRELRLQRTTNILQTVGNIVQDPNHPIIQVLLKRILDLAEVPYNAEAISQPVGPSPDQVAQQQGEQVPQSLPISPANEIAQSLNTVENQAPTARNTAVGE